MLTERRDLDCILQAYPDEARPAYRQTIFVTESMSPLNLPPSLPLLLQPPYSSSFDPPLPRLPRLARPTSLSYEPPSLLRSPSCRLLSSAKYSEAKTQVYSSKRQNNFRTSPPRRMHTSMELFYMYKINTVSHV